MTSSRSAKWAALVSVASLAVASATVGGTHGAFAGETDAGANIITAMPDFRGPTVSPVAIGKSTGTATTGAIQPGATYRVYADVTDVGTPPSGTDTVTADVSTVTAGQVSVALVAGSYTAGGATYNYRSEVLTAGALPNGPQSFSVRAVDAAGNVTIANGSVAIDNTAPAATNISASGGIAGRPEVGDTMTLTYSDVMDPDSLLAGWDGSALTVQARFRSAGGGDRFEVWDSGLTTQVAFGTISMGRTDFTTGTLGFTGSTMTMTGSTVTIVLGGSIVGTVTTVGGTGTMRWTPSASATDVAGNPTSTTALNEPGAADRDF
jgi:hypothetical protein